MKKYLTVTLSLLCILLLASCNKKSYEIEIIIPSGSIEEFVYSDVEIRPIGNEIKISSGERLGDTEVILKPVNKTLETEYVAQYLTQGMPVTFNTENTKSEWFKIGVSVQNDSDKSPISISVKVEGVELRIIEKENNNPVVKEWSKQEIISMFTNIKEEKWNLIDCVLIPDNAYDRVGAVLFWDEMKKTSNVAFFDKYGYYQQSGAAAKTAADANFTYLGDGTVTYKLKTDDGEIYNYTLTISIDDNNVHFQSKSDSIVNIE